MAFEDLAFKPPVHAIRVKTCGNDWVTDCDATDFQCNPDGLARIPHWATCPFADDFRRRDDS